MSFVLDKVRHFIILIEFIEKKGAQLHITCCKRLRFASSKFGFAQLFLQQNR